MKKIPAILLSAVLLLSLAGCSFSASLTPTVAKSSVAHLGAKALQNTVGLSTLPKVTCGSGRVDLKKGETLKCLATDPSTGKIYDATVEITKVKGSDYSVHIQVAKTPNS